MLSNIPSYRSAVPNGVESHRDAIALKALEKDREMRYESAGALARDMERYLAGEAVEAQPPSRRYRLRKF